MRRKPHNQADWTPADAAELDVLLHELTGAYFDHRDRCAYCVAWRSNTPGATPCPYLASAISIVLDWRERRQLLTRAENLRVRRRCQVEAA